ncbi:MAG TPA: hypothetical protein VEY95_10135 [Azospirillaceae bacterium]|nr:hypothetical protein [Azospirillaceae bacterium]
MRKILLPAALMALAAGAAQAQQSQPPGAGAAAQQDLGPQMRRLMAPAQPQDMTLRPLGAPLSALLNQGWEMVAASVTNGAEMYVLRQRGKHVRCLLLPTDLSAARPERLSLCAELN